MTTLNTPALIARGRISAVALLVMAGAFLVPHSASAETFRTMSVTFSYHKTDPAGKIYSAFQRKAKVACREDDLRPISLRMAEARCAADLLDRAVAKLGRADVAALHNGQMAVASR